MHLAELNSAGLQGDMRVRVDFVPDWTLDAPTFASLSAENSPGLVGGEKGGKVLKSDVGYTTPGGLWIPNKIPSSGGSGGGGSGGGGGYFFGGFNGEQFNGNVEGSSDVVSNAEALLSAGGDGNGVGGGGLLGSALGGAQLEDAAVLSGGKETRQESYVEDDFPEEELKNLNFLFDEPYEGHLNKPS